MFKVGDKVKCISNGFNSYYLLPSEVYVIEKIKIYKKVSKNDYDLINIKLVGPYPFLNSKRFISLKEYRKIKLNKICLTQEIK